MSEKGLNDLPGELRKLHTRGSDALLKDNFDYAIEMFMLILAKEPAVFDVRKALRTAQLKKSGSGGGFFKKMMNSAGASPLVAKAQIALRSEPAGALQIAEQILNSDPTNSAAHRIVVEAATALSLPRTAVLSLEILLRNSPKDRDVAIQFANALAGTGEVARAERMLAEFYKSFPNDAELHQALKDISARKTLDEGGYEALSTGTGSYRDILKDKEEAVKLEQENRLVQTEDTTEKLIKEYEQRMKSEPTNQKMLRSLAELYTSKSEFKRALEIYDKLNAIDGGADPTLARAIAETIGKRFDHELGQLDASAPDYTEKAARLQAEKQEFQLNECKKRVDKYPSDLQLRFELGQLYFQVGKIAEAGQEFQKAQGNPNRRISAMNFLAQCYARRKMYDLAARQLQNAIKEKLVFDDEKKDLLYNFGSVLESMGKKDESVEQFKQIYEVDMSYKDVAARVEASYSEQS